MDFSKFLILCHFIFLIPIIPNSQKVYFLTDRYYKENPRRRGVAVMDMETASFSRLGYHNIGDYISGDEYACADWAFGPDGRLYTGCRDIIAIYDLTALDTVHYMLLPPMASVGLAMAIDKNNIAYCMGYDNVLYRADLTTGTSANLGKLSYLCGDLTFRKGKLYGCLNSESGDIVEINLKPPVSNAIAFHTGNPTKDDHFFTSIFTISYGCDSAETYIANYGDKPPPNSDDYDSQVYRVDFKTHQLEYITTAPVSIGVGGAATMGEFIAGDCELSLDLDCDNSSGGIGADYDGKHTCRYPMRLCDTDIGIRNDYGEPPDSLYIIAGTLPDGINETISTYGGDPRFSLTQLNTEVWRLQPQAEVTTAEWQQYLQSLRYTNLLQGNATQGVRDFEFRLYYAYDSTSAHSVL